MNGVPRQFLLYIVAGLVAAVPHYGLLFLLVEAFRADPVAASAIGFLVGALVNYVFNHRVTFRSGKPHARALPQFAVVVALSLALNTALMALFVRVLGWHYGLSQVLVTGLLLVWNFALNRLWTFRG